MARVNGENGIPMRDLVEFELDPAAWEPGTAEFPEMRDLNLLPPEAAHALLSPLFEGAPRFLARWEAARPFEGDDDLVGGARRIARETKGRVKGRPKSYVFRYQATEKTFSLTVQFRRSQVSREEVVQALQAAIEDLMSEG